jgi:hypothetical protein
MDFILSFITAVEINGKVEFALGSIALSYLRGWMFIDMFACFPFEIVQPLLTNGSENSDPSQVSKTNNLARLARLPRFYRLIRIVRLFRLLKFNQSLNGILSLIHINKGVGKLITVLVSVWFVVHMVACAWFQLAE